MKKTISKKEVALRGSKGFTLIEVVLVLAIGGLIFLLAFIAFQQVSRNRRDTQRRSDAGRIIAELHNFKADKGVYPAAVPVDPGTDICTGGVANSNSFLDFAKQYLCTGSSKNDFKSPDGDNYKHCGAGSFAFGLCPKKNIVSYAVGAKCDPSSALGVAQDTMNPSSTIVFLMLESGTVCRSLDI